MNKDERQLELERKATHYELHQTMIEMNALKIEFISGALKWLDELELRFPEARDSLSPLSQKLIDLIEKLEDEIEESFEELLKVINFDA